MSSRAIAQHIRHMEARNLRPNTIYGRRRILARLELYCELHETPLMRADLELLRGYLARPTVGPQARAVEASHVREFFAWALAEGKVRTNPAARLERPRYKRGLPRPIPDDELRFALSCAPDPRVRPWLYLGAYAGLRAFDIANMHAEDLWIEGDRALATILTKGGGRRAVPLSPVVVQALARAALPTRGPLWPHPLQAGPVKPYTVSHGCNRHLHDLGIPSTFHTLRHWFATKSYDVSHDLLVLQELLGHASPDTATVYTYIDQSRASEVVNQLPVL